MRSRNFLDAKGSGFRCERFLCMKREENLYSKRFLIEDIFKKLKDIQGDYRLVLKNTKRISIVRAKVFLACMDYNLNRNPFLTWIYFCLTLDLLSFLKSCWFENLFATISKVSCPTEKSFACSKRVWTSANNPFLQAILIRLWKACCSWFIFFSLFAQGYRFSCATVFSAEVFVFRSDRKDF